ncbi:Tumor necrosis factor ligand superfamily member 12, partial [Ophiophagus hannah]
ANGTIRGWAEAKLNATNPLRYDNSRGEFTVIKRGLYYLYCQVHFNEEKTVYMKLDVMLSGQLALRCLEQFPPTSSGPQEAELHVCQVSGLLLLRPEASIRLRTIPDVRLKADRYLTYFGLFQDLAAVGQEAPQEKPRSGKKVERMMPLKIWRGGLNPFSGLDSWGVRQRPPTPWAVVGALAVGLLACLFMLFSIQASLESLKEELAMLRREGVCQASGTDGQQDASDSRQRDVGGPVAHALRTRWTRDVAKIPQQEPLMRPRKEGDATEIWWTPFLQQGRALEPSGQEVVVRHTGLYFVYSQVLFHDPTFTMGQVLRRVALGRPDQILFRCIQRVFHLQQGDRLSLSIPRFNASFDISTHGTFLGVLRL